MPGASWTERQPTDWLASNGRWYAASKYPKGWSTSALPPAPGHGGVGSILRQFVGTAVDTGSGAMSRLNDDASKWVHDMLDESDDDVSSRPSNGASTAAPSAAAPRTTATGTAQPGAAVVPTGRRVAEATISEPPPRLGNPAPPPPNHPAPPGRLAPTDGKPPMPAPPKQASTSVVPAPAPKSSFDVVAGDLGSVLGSAKRRIEQAINESAER